MRYTRPRLVVLVIAAITSSGQAQIKETWMHGDDFYDRLNSATDPAEANELLAEWFTRRTAGVLYVDAPKHTKEAWRKGFLAIPITPYALYVTGAKASTKRAFIDKLRSLEQAEARFLEFPSPAAGNKYQKLLGGFTTTYGRQSSILEAGADNLVFSFRKMNNKHVYDELTVTQDTSKFASLFAEWLADRSSLLFFSPAAPEVRQTWKTTFNPAKSEMLEKVFRATPFQFRGQLVAEMRAVERIENRLRADNSVEAQVRHQVNLRNFAEDWMVRFAAAGAPSGDGTAVLKVDVATVDRKSGARVNGHFVFFVPRGLWDDPSMFQRFDIRSKTETRPFWAGWYFFWSQHDQQPPKGLPADYAAIRIQQDATIDILAPPS